MPLVGINDKMYLFFYIHFQIFYILVYCHIPYGFSVHGNISSFSFNMQEKRKCKNHPDIWVALCKKLYFYDKSEQRKTTYITIKKNVKKPYIILTEILRLLINIVIAITNINTRKEAASYKFMLKSSI